MIRSALMAALAAVVLTPSPAAAQPRMSSEPITYTLRFPAPETHYVEVEASVPAGQPSIELMMAVWTPGSYLVREYERHVEQVAAKGPDGAALAVTKTQKNRWRVEAKGAPRVTVTYKVYGREMSVRTNWIESRFALLNGAPTFLTLAERGVTRPHVVALSLPAAWKTSVTSLAPVAGEAHRYQRRQLRRAGRLADPRRQPHRPSLRGRRQAARARQRRRSGGVRRQAGGGRRRQDRRRARAVLGRPAL